MTWLLLLFLRADGVFADFRDLELEHFFRSDLDCFAGLGVSSETRLALLNNEFSEAGEGEAVLCLLVCKRYNLVKKLDSCFFGKAGFFGKVCDYLRFSFGFGIKHFSTSGECVLFRPEKPSRKKKSS